MAPCGLIGDLFSWKMIVDTATCTEGIQQIATGAATSDYFTVTQAAANPKAAVSDVSEEEEDILSVECTNMPPAACHPAGFRHVMDPPHLLDVIGALAKEDVLTVGLLLPDKLTSGGAAVEVLPDPTTASKGEKSLNEDRFPFSAHGPCNHRVHWNHLKTKRRLSYYKCDFCGLHWRQLRPTLLDPRGRYARSP